MSASDPIVSIITPCYNYGRYLEACIESILGQSYPHIEYHIVDGGSTDDTLAIIRRYENRIAGWISEPDDGQTDAINKGFARCTGDIFAWLNADDRYAHEHVIAEVVEHYRQGARFISGEFNTVREDGSPSPEQQPYGTSQPCDFRQLLRFWDTICPPQPATFVDRELAAKVFPLDPQVECYMDYQLFLGVLAQNPPVAWTRKRWVNFIIHGQNKSLGNYTDDYDWEAECRRVFEAAAREQLSGDALSTWVRQFEETLILRALPRRSLSDSFLRAARVCPHLIISLRFWKAIFRKHFPKD